MVFKLFNILFSLFGFFMYIASYFSRELNLPVYYENLCCVDDRTLNLFLIFIPFLIFSIISFNFNNQAILKFSKISFIYIFIYIFIYFIVPTQGDGLIWLQRETISLYGSLIYLIVFIFIFRGIKNKN